MERLREHRERGCALTFRRPRTTPPMPYDPPPPPNVNGRASYNGRWVNAAGGRAPSPSPIANQALSQRIASRPVSSAERVGVHTLTLLPVLRDQPSAGGCRGLPGLTGIAAIARSTIAVIVRLGFTPGLAGMTAPSQISRFW